LILGFSLPVLLLLVIAITGLASSQQVNSSFAEVQEDSVPELVALDELRFASNRIAAASNELILEGVLGVEAGEEGDESELAEIETNTALYFASLATYRAFIEAGAEGEELELLSQIEVAGQELLDASNAMVNAQQQGASPEEIADLREDFEAVEDNLSDIATEAIEHEQEELIEREEDVADAVANARNIAIILSVVAIALTFAFALYLYQSIANPLQDLESTANQLREGNLQVRSGIQSTDEIGRVAQTFDTMAEQIGKTVNSLEEQIVETTRAKDAAQRSDQVKSAFLASMSHELRTPMNAVINFTKFVAKGDLGPVNEQQAETLEEVIDSAKHLLNLINDVLDMSKIESGSLRLFVDDNVDISALLETTISTGKGLLDGRTIDMQTDIAPDLPTIRGDRQRILQILLNIMSNACKFTDEGFVKTKAYQENGNVIVSVEDTGPGIASEDQPAVFEPFKQTSSGLRKGGGTGLGMPIAKNLTEAHGGRIWIESEPGKGATFYMSIPVRAEHLRATTVATQEAV
jgi:signal transduction histidine kinase